jgi:hypothetical protein
VQDRLPIRNLLFLLGVIPPLLTARMFWGGLVLKAPSKRRRAKPSCFPSSNPDSKPGTPRTSLAAAGRRRSPSFYGTTWAGMAATCRVASSAAGIDDPSE